MVRANAAPTMATLTAALSSESKIMAHGLPLWRRSHRAHAAQWLGAWPRRMNSASITLTIQRQFRLWALVQNSSQSPPVSTLTLRLAKMSNRSIPGASYHTLFQGVGTLARVRYMYRDAAEER